MSPTSESSADARRRANATARPVPDAALHAGFLRQASAAPGQIALVDEGEPPFTYGELFSLARRLAVSLSAAGARPESPVAVLMDKGWEQVVAVLGVTLAGAPYLPIDAELPAERIRYLLDNAAVELVVTTEALGGGVPRTASVRAAFPLQRSTPLPEDDGWQTPLIDPGSLAYVIYTSGSTGFPKGVMITHRAAVNTIEDMNRRFAVCPADRVLGVSALSFDLSVYDVFGTLAAGATLVLPERAHARNPVHLAKLLFAEKVTLWNSVPAMMDLVAEVAALRHKELPASLRMVWLSGDWIPLSLFGRLQQLRRGVEVISLGGATEAAIWSIHHPIREVDPEWRSIPYGKPLANQRFYVLDPNLDDCATGAQGDLFIAGSGLARGYWRDEERTTAAFVLHPRTGERLYRTGDLGRYMVDGSIEFLGREDGQVKIAGFRVELGEIQATLATHEGVRDVRVVAREVDKPGLGKDGHHKMLLAYYVQAAPGRPTAQELRAFLASKVPDYMIPHELVPVECFPLTPNGKVDFKAIVPTEPR